MIQYIARQHANILYSTCLLAVNKHTRYNGKNNGETNQMWGMLQNTFPRREEQILWYKHTLYVDFHQVKII